MYASYGFSSIEEKSPNMVYYSESKASFGNSYFADSPTAIEPLSWQHWVPALALFLGDARDIVRCMRFNQFGLTSEFSRTASMNASLASCRSSSRCFCSERRPRRFNASLCSWSASCINPVLFCLCRARLVSVAFLCSLTRRSRLDAAYGSAPTTYFEVIRGQAVKGRAPI